MDRHRYNGANIMRVSRNFTLAEATKSSTALRLGIDNTPSDDEIERIQFTAERILQPPRQHYDIPFVPSSWYRCLALNRAIGSKDHSQHVKAEAVDFEIPGISNVVLAHWLADTLPDWDQIILEFHDPDDGANSGWVHASISMDATANRKELLTISKSGAVYGLPEL